MIKNRPETDELKPMRLLCCDASGCGREQSFLITDEGWPSWDDDLIRAQAEVYGWSWSPDGAELEDLCPFCTPKIRLKTSEGKQ